VGEEHAPEGTASPRRIVSQTVSMRSLVLHGHERQEWDAAVGRLLAASAEAEARLGLLLRVLTGTEGRSAAYVLPREVPAMVGLAEDLLPLHVRDHSLLDDFRRWVHAVARLCALRTTIVHSVWELRADDGQAVMHPVWSNSEAGGHPMTADELTRTATALSRLLGPPADDLLLRLDKAAPELGVFNRC
jgi:hypothetical protein